MQWWKNAVYLIEIVMLADKNSLILDKSKTMDEIQNRYTTCVLMWLTNGRSCADYASPKFGEDRLILMLKFEEKKNGQKYSRMY